MPPENCATTPVPTWLLMLSSFCSAPRDYAAAAEIGDIVAVVHSHPNASANPSVADQVQCEASGLPWHIIAWPSGVWSSLEPTGYCAPLIGRPFIHGILDCYSLVRDYYRETLQIDLPDFERHDNWWKTGENLYLDNFAKAGFSQVNELQPHDGILMRIASDTPNHAAVYLGDGIILHHLYGRLSCREVYGGWYQTMTTAFVRHQHVA